MRKTTPNSQSGIALLSVLVFSVVALIVITTALSLTVLATQSSQHFLQGQRALHIAEAGAENAILRYLRNPGYTGETLTLPDGTATIVVSGSSPKILTITGQAGTAIRRIEVRLSEVNGETRVTYWQEIF